MYRIVSSTEMDNIFELSTHTSYYDNFLNEKDLAYMQDAKNRTGDIEYMSPNQYFKKCAEQIFHMPIENILAQRRADHSDISKYAEDMKSGDKFPLCFINFADGSQEGLHRMMAAGDAFGWDTKFPVLCIYVFDEEREARYKFSEEVADFRRYNFKKCCKEAADRIQDWDSPIPENVSELYKQAVIQAAKEEFDVDIDVDVDVVEDDGAHRLDCGLTSFNGHELEYVTMSNSGIWLEDLFDTESSSTADDIDIDDIDIDDMDIEDFFFK